jgi:molybdopterin-guanine dinucleotide biosynthesis protein A
MSADAGADAGFDPAFDALVLAGGSGRRMGGGAGTDKAMLDVGGLGLLDAVLQSVDGAARIVVVGPARPVSTVVTWTTEEPPGTGPAAAIVAGLPLLASPLVVVLATDLPFVGTGVPRLRAAMTSLSPVASATLNGAAGEPEAAMLVDDTGRRQPLIAVYRLEALRSCAGSDSWAGRSVRDLVRGLRVAEVPAVGAEALDCDTPDQLATARTLAGAQAATESARPPRSPRTRQAG